MGVYGPAGLTMARTVVAARGAGAGPSQRALGGLGSSSRAAPANNADVTAPAPGSSAAGPALGKAPVPPGGCGDGGEHCVAAVDGGAIVGLDGDLDAGG